MKGNYSFFNKLFRQFSKIDFIGPKFTFEFEDSDRHKSFQGAFFSSITFIVALVMAIIIGKDIYKRKNPSVASSNEYLDYSEIYLKDFPIIFNFYDSNATEIPNIHKYLDFQVFIFTVSVDSSVTTSYFNYTLIDCNYQLKHFSQENKNYVEDLLTKTNYKYLCINFDESMKFQNSFGSNNSTYIQILMSLCKEGSRETCDLSDNFIFKYSVNVAITFIDSYVDSTQYNEPVIKYINRVVQPLAYGVHKLGFFKVVNNEFISNDGWLLDSFRNLKSKEFHDLSLDIFLMNGDTKYFYVMNLESPTLRSKTNRSYMKIQDLFAKIGGIANALLIIISVVTSNFLRFKYLLFIREHTFNMMEKDYINRKTCSNNMLKNVDCHKSNLNKKDDSSSMSNPNERKIENSNIVVDNNNSFNRISPYIASVSQFKNSNINNPIEIKSCIYDNPYIGNSKLNLNGYNKDGINLINIQQIPVINNIEEKNSDISNNNSNNAPSLIKLESNTKLNNKNDIKNKNYPIGNQFNNTLSNINLKKLSIIEFKQEIGDILIGNSMKEFDENENISYLKYIFSHFCSCCINKDTSSKYNFEFMRVKKLLDIKTFKHFIMEAYYIHYNKC